jgi:acetolactate synthase-1/2/3 large subunit
LAPVVKGSVTLTPDSVGHWVAHAAQLALAEPRGPVHLDVPADAVSQPALPMATSVVPAPPPSPDRVLLDRAGAMILGAKRPIVIAGLQCRHSDAKWLRAFCEAVPAPVLTTYKAKGAVPDPHPLSMGAFTGGALEEPIVRRADLIITFGLDPVELIPRRWPYDAPVLCLARCPSTDLRIACPGGSAYFSPALEVVGDLGAILEELAPRLVGRDQSDWDVVEVDRFRRARGRALEVAVPGLAPHRLVQLARELTPAGTIATVDAGAHMLPATACWQALEPGELLISNGLAMMGFALPAAIGAQLVHPERRVLCFTGDGGLMVVASELETAVRLRLPILVVVFDDGALSLIQIKQEQKGYERTAMRDEGPDLAALARAFGVQGVMAEDEETFKSALRAALQAPEPVLIDARIDPTEYRAMLEIARGLPEA